MKDKIPKLVIDCPDKFKEMYKATIKDIMSCTGEKEVIII